MPTENFILLESTKILAVVCFEIEKRKPILCPFSGELFSQEIYIESAKDLTKYKLGEVIEVDVVEMQTDDGGYLYCNETD